MLKLVQAAKSAAQREREEAMEMKVPDPPRSTVRREGSWRFGRFLLTGLRSRSAVVPCGPFVWGGSGSEGSVYRSG